MEEEYSCYISEITTEPVSKLFSDLTIEYTSGFNVIARAQRYGRWYMLKGLNDANRDKAMPRQMLRKEFDILIRMQHPNVVQTIGMEQVEGLGTCIVMEYVEGITLKEWLQTKSKTKKGTGGKDADALRIMDELLQAVAYVHSLGIAHRDLKPQNIMLTRQGLHVKLIDFGQSDTDDYAVLKQPAGTVSYMSPEQMTMQIPDIRNDIYSIGVVMRQMPLPSYYKRVGNRCLLPIEERYQSIEEMEKFLSNEKNLTDLALGEGFVVRGDEKTDYFYAGDGKWKELGYKFDDGELTTNDVESNKATYKFAFKVDGKEVAAVQWDGYYPKFVRDKIDLSNKRGKFDEDDIDRLSYEQYLLYKMVEGKNDLVYGLIKTICNACSYPEASDYTTTVDGIFEEWNNDSARAAFGSL